MARSSGNLITLTSRLPWWAALLTGAGLYFLLVHVAPLTLHGPLAQAMEPGLKLLGYLLAAACAAGGALGLAVRIKQRLLYGSQQSLSQIRALSWSDFEHLIAEAFRREGFASSLTEPGADGGVDLVLSKARERWFVQRKQWRTRRIGVKTIRELAGVVSAAGVTGGIVVCSGDYTSSARSFARRSGIRLIDGAALSKMVCPEDERPAEAADPGCPRCGGRLVLRMARQEPREGHSFYGCSGFPKCRYTRDASEEAPTRRAVRATR